MSEILNKAKAHFREVLSQGLKGPVRVPEWDTEVWFKPAINFQQESKIIELQNQGKTAEALVEMLIIRALDKNGQPLFNKADKPEIMREIDPSIILRIITDMNDGESQQRVDTALGN
jgi:hypothetical protein